jgi:hypothetical protein
MTPASGSVRLQQTETTETTRRRCRRRDGSALTLAVVVRVVAVTAFRPTTRERPATDFATDESAQWEIRMVPLPRTGHYDTAVEHRLRAVEHGLVDERLEVASGRDTVVRALDLSM